MAQPVRNYEESQEFWKPVTAEQRETTAGDVCDSCGTDYPLGARFCYVCGSDRSRAVRSNRSLSQYLDFAIIRSTLGLTTASLVAFIVGLCCAMTALMASFIWTASTLLDWQAVQLYRIEFLMAAITAFVSGILLKR